MTIVSTRDQRRDISTGRTFRLALFAITLLAAHAAYATKAEGPFSVTAQIEALHAVVIVTTPIATHHVELQIYGADGLEVRGAEPRGPLRVKTLERAALSPGERWSVAVDFVPGEGRSYLNVFVAAPGQPPVVRAFSVGELSPRQKAERQAGTRLDPDGVPVKLMNPDEPKAVATPAGIAPGPAILGFPIHANAQIDEPKHRARISITTTRHGTNLTVKVYGLDGLIVEDGRPEGGLVIQTVRRATLAPGETILMEVRYRSGPGRSLLTVAVQGDGIGSVVRSFPVGQESNDQQRDRNRGVTVDPDGRPIRLMGN